MVLVSLYQARNAVYMCRIPFRTVSRMWNRILEVRHGTHSVSLNVRLIHHIESIFVAQLIEQRMVGIVARTHRIHVQLLHQFQVGHHDVPTLHMPQAVVMLVTVHALDIHRYPVHQQFRVLDFNPAETHLAGCDRLRFSRRIGQCQHTVIQIRVLGIPLVYPTDRSGE